MKTFSSTVLCAYSKEYYGDYSYKIFVSIELHFLIPFYHILTLDFCISVTTVFFVNIYFINFTSLEKNI